MPSMWVLCAFYVPSMWVVCTLYGVEDMRAAISCLRRLGRWRASVAAACLYSSFSLERKGPKVQGRHHRTQHTKRTLPRHVGRGPRAQPGRSLAFPHTALGKETALMDNAPAPSRHRGPSPFQRGCPKGGGLRSRDLLRSWDSLLSSLRVIARHEAIHL